VAGSGDGAGGDAYEHGQALVQRRSVRYSRATSRRTPHTERGMPPGMLVARTACACVLHATFPLL
jgi:hypothetical protein